MMVGSSAMVGWIDEFGRAICKQYYLQGLTQSEVIPDKGELHLTDVPTVAILHGATIYVGFQLKLAGRLSRQQILLAFGSEYPVQNQLCHHDDKTTIVFDFSAGYMANAPISIDDMKRNHGALGIIAWGVLLPAGAIAARYFRHLDPNWYYAHIFIQSMGFIIGLSGVLSGIQLHGKMRVDIPIHRGIGLFLLLLTMLQVMAFFLRPSKDSKFRRCWKCYHHVAGRLILFLGALNIALGIQDGSADYCWSIAYGFILAMVLITVSVLEVLLWTRRCERKTEPPASK